MALGKYQRWLTPEGQTLLEGWARDGCTDEELAKKMGIATGTLYAWKKEHPDINEAIKKGKEVVDYEVENTMIKRIRGYDYVEVTEQRDANDELVFRRAVKKHMPPDVAAMIFWLKNRKPNQWRDKPEPTKSADDKVQVIIDV